MARETKKLAATPYWAPDGKPLPYTWRRIDREAAVFPDDWQDRRLSTEDIKALPKRSLEKWWLFPEGMDNPWKSDALATVEDDGAGTWSASLMDGDTEEEIGGNFRTREQAQAFAECLLGLDGLLNAGAE